MRILLVGAGGVGTALARIAARRPFAELVIADYDLGRAQRAAAAATGTRLCGWTPGTSGPSPSCSPSMAATRS